MTALVSAFILDSGPPSTGILLNPRSISAPPSSLKAQYSSTLASSSSSFASHPSDSQPRSRSSTFGDATARKIRFAPLPDPRRDDFPSVFDESESDSPGQLPRHSSTPADFAPAPPSPALSANSLHDSELPSDDLANKSKPKSKNWGQKLLRPLLNPLLVRAAEEPNSRVFSQNAFKSSPTDPSDFTRDGVPLGRRVSANNITTTKESERERAFRDGAPLTHVWSEVSVPSNRGRKDGQRLLNGRVYGKRPASDKQSQDSLEPEFVEWGYGGMGSVSNNHPRGRNNATGLDWAKVQSRARTFVQTEDDDGEADDGSGMGWVRRRREQREREKHEREERERAENKHSVPEIEVHPPESKTMDGKENIVSRNDDHGGESLSKDEEYHIFHAISVPAPHHHHSRYHSRRKSGETNGTITPTSARSLSRANSVVSVPPTKQNNATLSLVVNGFSGEGSGSANSLASKSSSESLFEEDDDQSTGDYSSEGETRITCKSAGVEKISRHKD